MKSYYVNKDDSSNPHQDHEVHCIGCPWMPSPLNRVYLGEFSSAIEAVKAAKAIYPDADGCAHCCPEAHHS